MQLTDIVIISHVDPTHTQEKTTQADNSKGRGGPKIDLIEAERITYGNFICFINIGGVWHHFDRLSSAICHPL